MDLALPAGLALDLRLAKDGAPPRRRREKAFGFPAWTRLGREDRRRMLAFAHLLTRQLRRPGEHGGPLTRATLAVLGALLRIAHPQTGACFPGYERIAAEANCAVSTAVEAIKVLEAARLIAVVNRLRRVRDRVWDEAAGRRVGRERVVRISNGYVFGTWWMRLLPRAKNTESRRGPNSSEIQDPGKAGPVGDGDGGEDRRPARAGSGALEAALARMAGRAGFTM